jgi:hypothetical protein
MPRSLFTAAVLAFSLLPAAACSSSSTDSSAPAASSAAKAPGGTLPATAKNDSFSWTVTKIEYAKQIVETAGSGRTMEPPSGTTRFCEVTMTVKNLTSGDLKYGVVGDPMTDAGGKRLETGGYFIDGAYTLDPPAFKAGQDRQFLEVYAVDDAFKPGSLLLGPALGDDSKGVKLPLS